MSTPHAKLRKEITDWLGSIGAYYVCTNSGGYGRKGIPDILACIRGKFVAIECKVLPDKPSPWQMRELKAVQGADGISIVAHKIADVQYITPLAVNWVVRPGEHMPRDPRFEVETEYR